MTTSTKIDSSADVVGFLKAQHQQIKAGFAEVLAATGSERREAFDALRRLLAVHETAEEEIVHPRARHEIANGDTVVEARLAEEHEAKETLQKLESLDVASAEFDSTFRQFQADVISHAEAEESQEFAQLAAELDDAQLAKMRRAVEFAERITHPPAPRGGRGAGGKPAGRPVCRHARPSSRRDQRPSILTSQVLSSGFAPPGHRHGRGVDPAVLAVLGRDPFRDDVPALWSREQARINRAPSVSYARISPGHVSAGSAPIPERRGLGAL